MGEFGDQIEVNLQLREEVTRLQRGLEQIRDYDPPEVCKDEFAYDRFRDSIRDHARTVLRTDAPVVTPSEAHALLEEGRRLGDEVRKRLSRLYEIPEEVFRMKLR